MAKVERFEDLMAWQKARALACEIYQATRSGKFAHDFGLAGQIQRAVVSIMSNLAEGYERGSANEFHRFVCIAKASCAEMRSQLYVAHDIGYIDDGEFSRLLAQAEEVGRIIGGLRSAIERRRQADQSNG
jgi:four helix bundle protein